MKKIIVGMSGGVDSSVAALLLLRQGYQVEGLFMKNWEEDDTQSYCSAHEDLADAQAVADHLGIQLHTVNFATEYWDNVFEYFLAEYRAGRTPNPDVLCNREIKFKAFLERAQDLGADGIATGHYAALKWRGDQVQLLRSSDENKDQTYFLYMVSQRALQKSLFPLGKLAKPEVRRLAEEAGFPNHKKKDSTGICFIGERKFNTFLNRFLQADPGPIVTDTGIRVGDHQGLIHYTLGQRKGIGIGGLQNTGDAPWFVVDKDLATNTLVIGQGHDHPQLLKTTLVASQLHWISGEAPQTDRPYLARFRHRQPLQECRIELQDGLCKVIFSKPQRAITPGQSVVVYDQQICLGGGIIESAESMR